jgi:hypothetical protein
MLGVAKGEIRMIDDENKIGYKKPPRSTRYRKGHSGNPRGRPRGRNWRDRAPYQSVLGEKLTVRENGTERQVTAADVIVMKLKKLAFEGNGAGARLLLEMIEEAKRISPNGMGQSLLFTVNFVSAGGVSPALAALRLANVHNSSNEKAKLKLQPSVVQEALERLKDKRFTHEERKVIVEATRTPHKVKWPEYWTADDLLF